MLPIGDLPFLIHLNSKTAMNLHLARLRGVRTWACLVAVTWILGCQSSGHVESGTSSLSTGGGGSPGNKTTSVAPKDRLLHDYRSAAAHMRAAEFAQAKPLLDDALLTLGGLSAGDKSAKQSRNLFRSESTKTFRGEPYERVMAYYYRGILYWMDGEPDNARACFRSAALQDADPEQGKYQSDYVLLDYLDGFASTKLAGDGSDAFNRAKASLRQSQVLPPYDSKANVLVFVEMGRGPSKVAMGQYGEKLGFSPGTTSAVAVDLKVSGVQIRALAYDDLSFQATTRGGRVMDQVLANKAGFKEGTDTFGNSALISGAILSTQQGRGSSLDEVGAGLLVAGLVGKLISAATTPRADTRQWDNLPNLLGFATLQLPAGQHTLVADFVDAQSRVTTSKQAVFSVVPGRDVVLFFSDRN